MKSILMVCLGNICRSPVAEGILKQKINQANLSIEVDSAGTSNYHIGSEPDRRSQKNALKHGIDLSTLRARQFKKEDFGRFDIIYAMDSSNYQNILALAKNDEEKSKVKLILNELKPATNNSVPDPYYGDGDGFETVFKLLDSACENIVTQLKKE